MLVLRKSQIEALAADLDQRTEEKLYATLRDLHPDQFAQLGEAGARVRLRQGLEQAASWGLRRWTDIAFVVDLLFRYGSYDHPAIAPLREIFERTDLSGSQQVALAEWTLRKRDR